MVDVMNPPVCPCAWWLCLRFPSDESIILHDRIEIQISLSDDMQVNLLNTEVVCFVMLSLHSYTQCVYTLRCRPSAICRNNVVNNVLVRLMDDTSVCKHYSV